MQPYIRISCGALASIPDGIRRMSSHHVSGLFARGACGISHSRSDLSRHHFMIARAIGGACYSFNPFKLVLLDRPDYAPPALAAGV